MGSVGTVGSCTGTVGTAAVAVLATEATVSVTWEAVVARAGVATDCDCCAGELRLVSAATWWMGGSGWWT